MNRVGLLLLFAFLAGCAGNFNLRASERSTKPAEKAVQLKHGMDRRTALAVFGKYATPQPGNSGYCGGSKYSFDPESPITINDAGYSLHAYKAGDLISSEQQGSKTRFTYKKVYYEESRKFASLGKIRISRVANAHANCTKPARDEVTLSLQYGPSDSDVIMVAPGNLDEMVSALLVLAPQAKLQQN